MGELYDRFNGSKVFDIGSKGAFQKVGLYSTYNGVQEIANSVEAKGLVKDYGYDTAVILIDSAVRYNLEEYYVEGSDKLLENKKGIIISKAKEIAVNGKLTRNT